MGILSLVSVWNSFRMLLLAVIILAAASTAVYVPGQPGAAWTKEELLIVKAKLYGNFRYGRFSPTVLRLGFHDCLKYKDGSGGCDGCLNWHGVGDTFNPGWCSKSAPNVGVTNNNNLEGV